MKKIFLLFSVSVLFIFSIEAQIDYPILTREMTFEQAKLALLQQMANINHYYFNKDYYKNITKYESNPKKFSWRQEPFELLPRQQVIDNINSRNWQSWISQTLREQGSRFGVVHGFDKIQVGSYSMHSYRHHSVLKKVFYANGTVLVDPKILATDRWYKDLKPIDSVLVDATIVFPTATAVMEIPVKEAQKNDLPGGGYIWFMNYYEDILRLSVTDNIKIATIHILTDDGERLGHEGLGTYAPIQPTSEMSSYAGKVYQYCESLLKAIDKGVYTTVESLLEQYEKTKLTPPVIQNVYRYAWRIPENSKTLEITYFATNDSVVIKNIMVKNRDERLCNYGIASVFRDNWTIHGLVDLNGRWIVDPAIENGALNEVAGIFFRKLTNNFSQKKFPLLKVNIKQRTLDATPYIVSDLFDKKFLLVENENGFFGILHSNGRVIIPTEYKNITYDSSTKHFIAESDSEPSSYIRFDNRGRKRLK